MILVTDVDLFYGGSQCLLRLPLDITPRRSRFVDVNSESGLFPLELHWLEWFLFFGLRAYP